MLLTSENVGSVVKQLRELRGLSQTDLAKQLHVHQPLVSRIEAGKRNPPIGTLLRLFEALDVEVQVLLREEVDAPT